MCAETILTTVLVHGKCWYDICSYPCYYCRNNQVLGLGSNSALQSLLLVTRKTQALMQQDVEASNSGVVLLDAMRVICSVFSPCSLRYQ